MTILSLENPPKKSFTWGDKIHFGRHKGQTFEWIFNNDPDYLEWLDDNDIFEFTPEQSDRVSLEVQKDLPDWNEWYTKPD